MRPSQRSALLMAIMVCLSALVAGLSDVHAQNTSRAIQIIGTQSSDPDNRLPSASDQLKSTRTRQLNELKTRQLNDLDTRQKEMQRLHEASKTCDSSRTSSCKTRH